MLSNGGEWDQDGEKVVCSLCLMPHPTQASNVFQSTAELSRHEVVNCCSTILKQTHKTTP